MLKTQKQQNNKGQVIVLLVIGMIILLGFVAMAIDGGMVFGDRRYAQNAADSASLAAAAKAALLMDQFKVISENFDCTSILANTALIDGIGAEAINAAAMNRFTITQFYSMPDKHGVYVDCVEEDLGGYVNHYLDIYVLISSETETSFSSVIFGDLLENRVASVVRVKPKTSLGYGMAIIAMNPECQTANDGLVIGGDSTVTISNNGAHTNGCLTANGGVVVNTPQEIHMTYAGTYVLNGGSVIDPPPEYTPVQMEPFPVDVPACDENEQNKVTVNNGDNETLSPGTYKGITLNGGNLYLSPGLYCLTGAFKLTGGFLNMSNPNENEGITIYMGSGDFTSAGGVHVEIRSASEAGTISLANGAIPGFLFYMPASNSGTIKLVGDSSSTIDGTVYAPAADVHVGGSSGTMTYYGTQIIGLNVNIEGGTDVSIEFQGSKIFHFNENIQLEE